MTDTFQVKPLTAAERKELERLDRKWSTMRASAKEIRRAMELDRRRKAASVQP